MSHRDPHQGDVPRHAASDIAALDWPQLILDGLDEPLLAVDKQWTITYINEQAAQVLQVSRDMLIRQNLWHSFPSLSGSIFETFYHTSMAEGGTHHLEAFSAQTQRWYDLRTAMIPQGLIISFQEITHRKRLELQMQTQNLHLQVLADISQIVATMEYDTGTVVERIAQRIADAFGDVCAIGLISDDQQTLVPLAAHGPDPILVARIHAVNAASPLPLDGPERIVQVARTGRSAFLPHVTSEEMPQLLRSTMPPSLRQFRIFSMMLVPLIVAGRSIGVINLSRMNPQLPSYTPDDQAFAQDLADRTALVITNTRLFQDARREVTERTKTERILRQTQAQFEGIVQSAMDAIISIDESLRIIVFNRAAEAMFLCTAADVIGQPLDRFLPSSAQAHHATYIRHFGRTGVTARTMQSPGMLMARRANGEEFFIEATISQTHTDNRQIYTVVIRDITARKHLQEQLIQSQKMETVGRLAGGIAHDFNNILTAIHGYSDLVLSDLATNSQTYKDIVEIQYAAQRATALTRQLLTFSRQHIIQPKRIDLNEVISSMEKLLRRTLNEQLTLSIALEPQPLQILVDPNYIEQVLLNLVVNARDAMEHTSNGRLAIETSLIELDEHYRANGHIEIQPGWYALLAVSDTGTGMDATTKAHIFEPFFTTKEVGKGTGLGLATVYGIVQQCKGYIWVYSEVGFGTTFKVYIPLADMLDLQATTDHPDTSAALNDVPFPHRSAKTWSILVVEDDGVVQDVLRRTLTEAGYVVFFADDGREALEILLQHASDIDLVLSDMIMPRMSGDVLIAHVRTHHPELRFLCMSGYTKQTLVSTTRLQACDGFLQKPFTVKLLLKKVREMLLS